MKQLTGWHVLGMFTFAFAIIITVNLTLAFNAVRTFPGIEVKNSYVASQNFDAERAAQEALNWDVEATLSGSILSLKVVQNGRPIEPTIEKAVFGRATSVQADQVPAFEFDGAAFVAPVIAGDGNWNLRVSMRAEDGTLFQQRVQVRVLK